METGSATLTVALDAAAPDRRLHRRRPAAYAAWLAVGSLGTFVDKIHEHLGVVSYPDKEWIGERLPVSPVYLTASVGFFLLYTLVVGHRGRAQGLFGGRPISAFDFGLAMGSWIFAYVVTGYLGSPQHAQGPWPWIASLGLWAWAAPDLWLARRTWLFVYVLLVAALGVGFEWSATAGGAFHYPICPSAPCLGATVPAVWLLPLYVHAALFIHRMLGGRHWVRRWLDQVLPPS